MLFFDKTNNNEFDKFSRLFFDFFADTKEEEKEYTIYIDGYGLYNIANYLPRVIYALTLRERLKCDIVFLSSVKLDRNTVNLLEGLDIKIVNISRFSMHNIILGIREFLNLWMNYSDIYKIDDYQYCEIKCGSDLADTFIRSTKEVSYNRMKLAYLKPAIKFFARFNNLSNYINEQNTKGIYLVHEVGHWYATMIKIALENSFDIIQCTAHSILNCTKNVKNITSCDVQNALLKYKLEMIDELDIDYVSWADEYYSKRKNGITDRDASSAYGGYVLTKREFFDRYKADPQKKNVVIMAHCFSDEARGCTSRKIYVDYVDWLISTLEIIKEIKDVNWILRAHPARFFYNEGNLIFDIFDRYKCDNIFVLDDGISGNSLFDIVDAAVTVAGTCGLEFPSLGIPVVIAGKAAYAGNSFVKEAFSQEEYRQYLRNMNKIEPLDEENVKLAKKVSYAYFQRNNAEGNCAEVLINALNMEKREALNYVLKEFCNQSSFDCFIKQSFYYCEGIKYVEERYA